MRVVIITHLFGLAGSQTTQRKVIPLFCLDIEITAHLQGQFGTEHSDYSSLDAPAIDSAKDAIEYCEVVGGHRSLNLVDGGYSPSNFPMLQTEYADRARRSKAVRHADARRRTVQLFRQRLAARILSARTNAPRPASANPAPRAHRPRFRRTFSARKAAAGDSGDSGPPGPSTGEVAGPLSVAGRAL